jgi:glycosyltransferase involved in cell wall biosynthesis
MPEYNNTEPFVSVLMITYDRASYIESAIKSILDQDYGNFEVIIMDDASTDNTEAIVRELKSIDPRIKYFKNAHNMGIPQNRNMGLAHASGKYVAILDSDDLWSDKTKLRKQVEFLENDSSYGLVGTQVSVIDASGAPYDEFHHKVTDPEIRDLLLAHNQFTNSSVLFLRQLATDVGGYDLSCNIWEDFDLFLRMGMHTKFANIDMVMTAYRTHPGGVTKQRRTRGALKHLQIIRRYGAAYPHYAHALLIGYLRLLKSIFL